MRIAPNAPLKCATLSATPELMKWHKQRLNILATLTDKDPKDEF